MKAVVLSFDVCSKSVDSSQNLGDSLVHHAKPQDCAFLTYFRQILRPNTFNSALRSRILFASTEVVHRPRLDSLPPFDSAIYILGEIGDCLQPPPTTSYSHFERLAKNRKLKFIER